MRAINWTLRTRNEEKQYGMNAYWWTPFCRVMNAPRREWMGRDVFLESINLATPRFSMRVPTCIRQTSSDWGTNDRQTDNKWQRSEGRVGTECEAGRQVLIDRYAFLDPWLVAGSSTVGSDGGQTGPQVSEYATVLRCAMQEGFVSIALCRFIISKENKWASSLLSRTCSAVSLHKHLDTDLPTDLPTYLPTYLST